jgi:hypothetical protein
MNLEENYLFYYILEGHAAANIYDKFTNSQLVVDWSFDALYFQFNNKEWITLSIGPETTKNEIHEINTPEMIRIFLKLCCYAVENIKGRSYKINKALNEIREILK